MKTRTLGKRLYDTRKRLKMTRESLAMELGESPPVVRAWEMEFNDPRPEKVNGIEDWLAKHEGRNGR